MSNIVYSPDPSQLSQYRRAVLELENELKTQDKRNRQNNEKEVNDLTDTYKAILNKKDQAAEKAISGVREQEQAAFFREKEDHTQQTDQIREQLYNARGELSRTIPQETHKNDLKKVIESANQRHLDDESSRESQENEFHRTMGQVNQKYKGKIDALTGQHGKEMDRLSDEIKELHDYGRKLDHQTAEEKGRFTVDTEKQFRGEKEQIEDSYQGVINHMQGDLDAKEGRFSKISGDVIREKEEKFSKLISKENMDHHRSVKQTEEGFERQLNDLNNQKKQQEIQSSKVSDAQQKESQKRSDAALLSQASNYEATINRLTQSKNEESQQLKSELQKEKTSNDPEHISQAAEANLRKNVVSSYEKAFKVELDRNRIATTDKAEKFNSDYNNLLLDSRQKEALLTQKNAQEVSLERTHFLGDLHDIEENSNAKARQQSQASDREMESIFRLHGHAMERQRKDYERMLQTSKDDSQFKLAAFQKEAEIRSKDAQRASNLRQNELIREYDEKLAKQKDDYELKIDNLKAQAQTDLQEIEKRTKQELESQQKGFEQRLTQVETQTKERERTLTQSYQIEMDKIRRNYEQANQKKS